MSYRQPRFPVVLGSAVALVAALPVLAPPVSAQEGPSGPTTIPGFVDAFVSAARTWDHEAFTKLAVEDVVLLTGDGRVLEGRDEYRETWRRSWENGQGVNPLQVTVVEAIAEGDLAVVRADYGPEAVEPVGSYVWTLRRGDDGSWGLWWWVLTRKGG